MVDWYFHWAIFTIPATAVLIAVWYTAREYWSDFQAQQAAEREILNRERFKQGLEPFRTKAERELDEAIRRRDADEAARWKREHPKRSDP